MSRSERLLQLAQMLRGRRWPATGAALAGELGISLRSLYRDLDALRRQGARIDGEAGVGFLLRPGFSLPPLNFTEEELGALALGLGWVLRRPDRSLSRAARGALDKINAVLPDGRREALDDSGVVAPSARKTPKDRVDLEPLRRAIRREQKVEIRYAAGARARTRRVLWPLSLAYFDRVQVLAAWCETRKDFRHFRTDRILALAPLGQGYPRRRADLLREWESRGLKRTPKDC